MTTRLKTVHYTFPVTAAVVNNTLTTMTQITIYLPETGTKTFRSVIATMSTMITDTAAGNVTSRNLQCRLGAAAYTANNNANAYPNSGEDIFLFHSVDLTAHFTTNWTGASMTMDAQVQINSAATTAAETNCCVTVAITYEYDDTSTTQVKTVFIPLDMPVGALAITKPGAALSTIPNLTTDLPESTKVFRSVHIVVQGNISLNLGTVDPTLTFQLDSTAAHTTGIFEAALATDYYFRYVWDCSAVLVTNATNGWYAFASVAKFNHLQAYLVVTYEFDASANTGCRVSVMLPLDLVSPMGGVASADFQKGVRELFIEEPGTITTKQVAYYVFWTSANTISGLNMRIGAGAFVTYTDAGSGGVGSCAAMVRNDAAFTLTRGRNELNYDVYRTDTSDVGTNVSGFFIVNYNCSAKPTGGFGSENHTIFYNLGMTYDGAAAALRTSAAVAPVIPEVDYFISANGILLQFYGSGAEATAGAVGIVVERLTAEGGHQWELAYLDMSRTSPETGLYIQIGQIRTLFWRWPSDVKADRMNLETARKWLIYHIQASVGAWNQLDLMFTYHTQFFTVAGTVSGYADADGAGLTVELHRASDGELLKTTTTTAGGAYTFSWYDNTENVFTACFEDSTHVGTSPVGLAT